ncbi:MAG: M15 family metallopeptidase [Clostridia bacterium]|nr:M15 family metallopeptidase [Clostridia bacterium]
MNNNPNNRPRQNQQYNQQNGQRPVQQNRQPVQRQPMQQRTNYNGYNPYPPVKHKSRRKAYRAAGLVVLSVIILVMLFVSVIIFAARCATGQIGDPSDTGEKNGTSDLVNDSASGSAGGDTIIEAPTTTRSPETEPETTALAATFEYVTKTEADMHKGYLILVNYQNAYSFDTDFKIQTFYGNRNKSYKLRDTLVSLDSYAMDWCNQMMAAFEADTGKHDILVNSAYRTMEEQESIYSARVSAYGEEYAKSYVQLPGYSEHHTGLAIDFTIYTDAGESKTFDAMTDYPQWLTANAHRFGYIQRYASDKTDITKVAYENWHYRYVGKPHAYYMVQNNLCLEEYIEKLRGHHTFDGEHLLITDDEGASWEIYFVPSAGETTQVPVPKYQEYTISGNNVDGFIVTMKG